MQNPHKWHFYLHHSCSIQNNSLPLHREPALGMSAHQRRRVADIIKRRLLALVLVVWNPAKFLHPKQESDKCPLVCLIRCVHNDEHISVGIHCLFL